MRISRIHGIALLAAILALAAPGAASAQLNVSRSQMVTTQLDAAQQARLDAVNAELNALFDAQRAFFAANGRYAASFAELPAFSTRPESRLVLAVGPDWYVALGGEQEAGVMQHIVYSGDRVPQAAVEAARQDARGAVLNPSTALPTGG